MDQVSALDFPLPRVGTISPALGATPNVGTSVSTAADDHYSALSLFTMPHASGTTG